MVSAALNEYLSEHGNGETFDGLLAKPPIKELAPFDGSHPLTDYFISSSHNTYLLANQLWGAASPQAYTTALHGLAARAPARCVELDVWWTSKKGPILTHGHTLTGSVPFQEACLAIGNAIGPNDLPAWISLECHVDADKQPQLVKIMEEAWGDKLLSLKLEHVDGEKVSPNDLRGKIVMMVEWYPSPGNVAEVIIKAPQDDSSSSSDSDDDDNDDVKEMQEYRKSHKGVQPKIYDGLAKLGIYANSFKPKDGWLEKEIVEPLHALVNISEMGGDDIPHAEEGKSRSLYVVAKLFKGAEKLEWKTKSIKDHDADPMFLSTVEWDWEDDDLVFLRVELKEDVWGRDQEVASYTLLVDRLATGLRFWPLFDKTGMPSVGRLLVDVDFKVGA
ncbi:hypothetical protein FRC19_007034 [Serendipita sp. 401]|nr:hypothetical protein FRC19_007034 [Serendipita sp. 401]